MLMSAGSSPAGRKFAVNNVDCLFMVITEEDKIAVRCRGGARRARRRQRSGFMRADICCAAATPKETEEYYHYLVREKGDWEAAEQIIAKRAAGGSQSLSPELMRKMMERVISGGATFPVIGSYDRGRREVLAAVAGRTGRHGLDSRQLRQ